MHSKNGRQKSSKKVLIIRVYILSNKIRTKSELVEQLHLSMQCASRYSRLN